MRLLIALIAAAFVAVSSTEVEAPFDEDIALDPQLYMRKLKKNPFGRTTVTAAAKNAATSKGGPLVNTEALRAMTEGSGFASNAGVEAGVGHRFAAMDAEAEAEMESESASEAEGSGSPQEGRDRHEVVAERRAAKGFGKGRSKAAMEKISKAVRERMKSAMSGGVTYAKPTMTDVEYCQGCQLIVSQVLEHTTAGSSHEEVMFALHSACHEPVPIIEEVCEVMVDRDVLVAQELAAVARDAPFVCMTLGMCYE